MKLFNKVAIVGTGLIGGSIALAIKKKGLAKQIVGVSRHKKTLGFARRIGAIDRGSQGLNIIQDADLVILATPISAIISLAPKISQIIGRKCIVTDVGSTKQQIVSKLEKIFPFYIGSHPLAGSEKRGVTNASSNIFRDSLVLLTPTKNTNKEALGKIRRLWNGLGTKVVSLSPDTHDKVLSFSSHLPHTVAFSLIATMPKKYLRFASSGLKDTTRIAASDNELWADIFLSNPKNIITAIGLLQNNLLRIKLAIQRKDKKLLAKILKEAKAKREALG